VSNPHPGRPGLDFEVFSPRRINFSTLIEAFLPLVFFQDFPSLSLWVAGCSTYANSNIATGRKPFSKATIFPVNFEQF